MTRISPLREADVVVAGAGAMAAEHVRALLARGLDPARVVVAARRPERAEELARVLGVRAEPLDAAAAPLAIVAVTEDALPEVALALLARGARRVLVEKPGALGSAAFEPLAGASVYVAYNRRFYASVRRARALIEEDGGPIALTFDFTEVEPLVLRELERRGVRELPRWGTANSLHVIDLAFHLAGDPERLACDHAGSLEWHPAAAVFSGSGSTTRGALFAYIASWSGAGRWSVEVTTRKRRLVLRPLEQLWQQLRGSFDVEPVALEAEPGALKPGLAAQLDAFLAEPVDPALCDADTAAARLRLAERMLGYGRSKGGG